MGRGYQTITAFLVCATGVCHAGDWPMWRYDAARSGASPDEIADKPVLLWSQQLPPTRQAWPLEPNQRLNYEPRLTFDAAYEPVVMGKLLFLASPNDGSITAYDTETGAERWKFYAEGPVRCAPACAKGKVFAGSDDGYLYCLDASTGNLLWKHRGAPAERPDRRQLGNGHLVSFWPVRGGPVVANGTVYFGAGIWPIFGVFLLALDAETGTVKWENRDLQYIADPRGRGNGTLDTGLSPQGHFGLIRDRLVVPCGRSLPAGLDAVTGKLIYYQSGWRRGDSRVALHGDYAFVGKEGVVNLNDFCEIGTRWGICSSSGNPYKMLEGCDASSAFENGVAYGSAHGTFFAYDVSNAKTVKREAESFPGWGVSLQSKWEPPVCWQFPTPCNGQPSGVTVKAGKRVYGYAGKKLLALTDLGGPPRIVWEKDVEGTPRSLIAADNKLFVATAEGGLYCFGGPPSVVELALASSRPQPEAARPDARSGPTQTTQDAVSAKAQAIVNATGVKAGYCLVLGLSDGRLVEALLKQTQLTVIAVDADAAKVDVLRRRCAAADLLGSRVELFTAKPFEFLFPPYLASLIVSEDAQAAGLPTAADAARLFDVLHPYGGTLCLDLPADPGGSFDVLAKAAATATAKVKAASRGTGAAGPGGNWSLWVREGGLPGSAPWSHEGADAANTFCSQDDAVKAPLGFLWYGDAPVTPIEYPSLLNLKAEVSGGRVYTHGPRGNSFLMNVSDAYTGRLLWTNEVRTHYRRASSAIMADGIYVAADGRCSVYDLQSGKETRTFTFSTNKTFFAASLRVAEDVILVACADVSDAGPGMAVCGYTYGDNMNSLLVCIDRQTGAELWRRQARQRFHDRALAVGGGLVFFVDSLPLCTAEKAVAKEEDLKELESTVIAIDARTGKEAWSQRVRYDATRKFTGHEYETGQEDTHVVKQYGNDWLAYAAESDLVLAGRFLLGGAWEAKSGKARWQNKEVRGCAPIIVRGQTLVTSSGFSSVYDVLTGERIARYSDVRRGGCNYAIGSKHLITIRSGHASYYDVAETKAYQLRNIRSGCLNNLIAADGLLNSPCFPNGCICNYPVQTSFALMHMPEVAEWSGATPLVMTPPGPADATPGPRAEPKPALPAGVTYAPIDLGPVVNRGLKDETVGDGLGWKDWGPEEDLRDFPTGDIALGGVPFHVTPGATNCVVLHASKARVPAVADFPARVAIPVNKKHVAGLWFLHTGGWMSGAAPFAWREIHYADGATEAMALNESNTADWNGDRTDFPTEEGSVTKLAWQGACPSVPVTRVYMTLWVNPHPEKEIREVVLTTRDVPEKDWRFLAHLGLTAAIAPGDGT